MTILIPENIKAKLPAQLGILLQAFLRKPIQSNYWKLVEHIETARTQERTRTALYSWLCYWLYSEVCIRQGHVTRFLIPRSWDHKGLRLALSPGMLHEKTAHVSESIVVSCLALVSDRSFEKLERWLSLGDG
jgi:hypothetical protein